MLRYCANLKAIKCESTSLNRIVVDKSHRVIVPLKKVLPFDKKSNNNLLFHCLKFLDSECSFIDLDFDTSTTQQTISQKMADQEWCDFYVVFTVSLCAY